MAVNKFIGYSDKIGEYFTIGSLFKGKTSTAFKFTGLKTVAIMTPVTVDEVDMTNSGSAQYGTTATLQDTVQEITCTRDKGFSYEINDGDQSDQNYQKEVGKSIKAQLDEKSIPGQDKYFIDRVANLAGNIVGSASLSKTTAYQAVLAIRRAFVNAKVPNGNRYLAMRSEIYALLQEQLINLAPLPEGNAKNIVDNGVVATIAGFKVIETPDDYFPDNCFLVAWHHDSVVNPVKIDKVEVKRGQAGHRGAVVEGSHYSEVAVLGHKNGGTYSLVANANKLATPTVTAGALKFTIAGTASTSCKYTTDGTDPRYSKTALSTTGSASFEIAAAAGDVTVKAVTFASGKFASDVVTSTVTVTAE